MVKPSQNVSRQHETWPELADVEEQLKMYPSEVIPVMKPAGVEKAPTTA